MDGLEATARIRQFEEKLSKKPVPIIGLTGHDNPEITEECMSNGMNLVLLKPMKKCDVIEALKKFT